MEDRSPRSPSRLSDYRPDCALRAASLARYGDRALRIKPVYTSHDFQKHTAEALPELLHKLKAGGYKVVQMKAKAPVQTIAQYDDEILKDAKLPTVSSRPVSSVVQTISE